MFKSLHPIRAFTAILLILCVSQARAGYKQVHAPAQDDPMAVAIFQLDNGLTVYLSENHEKPTFSSMIAVRAGGKHDPAETTGLAHYLEHMLFKGTSRMGTLDYEKEKPHLDKIKALYEQHFQEEDPQKRKAIYAEINRESQAAAAYAVPNEIDKLYKIMGDKGLNAGTSTELTVYTLTLPSNRLRHWAAIESERFREPIFRLFHTELETVYEEKNRLLDNKSRILSEAVESILYKKHPYGQQTVIGHVDHLKNPSLVNVQRYYDIYYVPNNMAIVISGDIATATAIQIIDEYFSSWKAREIPGFVVPKEPPLKGAERISVQYPAEPKVILAFRTAKRHHPDADVLELIDMILDNSTAGLINLNLNQKQMVRHASSWPEIQNDYGAQFFSGTPKKGQALEEVEKLLLGQIEQIKQGKFEDQIIPAIITDFKKRYKADLENNGKRARRMTEGFLTFTDWRDMNGKITRMEKITRKDVIRVANKYFGSDYVAAYRTSGKPDLPTIEKPKIDKIDIDPSRQSAFAKAILAIPVKPIEPRYIDPAKDFQKTDLAGCTLYYAKNPINDLFTFRISIEMGTLHDNCLGIAAALLDKSGIEAFSSGELKKQWYRLGTNFSISAGRHQTTISISGLDENLDRSLALLVKVLTKPEVSQAVLDEMVDIHLTRREDAKKDHKSISAALYHFNRYGKQSPYLTRISTARMKKLTVAELQDLISSLLDTQHTFTYTGSLPMDEVLSVVSKACPVNEKLKAPPPYQKLTVRIPKENEILFFNKDMAQAQIRIEFSNETYKEDRIPAIQFYNQYFAGGMSGIVFQELREARALAYSAGARYLTGNRKEDQDIMVGVIGTQADKTLDALAAFIDLIDNLPNSPDRFKESRESLISNYRTSRINFRNVIGTVRGWERLGLAIDPREARYKKISSADMSCMLDFFKEHIKDKPKMISIVGDKARINMKTLGAFGKITEVNTEDIFLD